MRLTLSRKQNAMTMLPLPPFARPVVVYDQVLELTDATVVVAKSLPPGSPCFDGHFAGFPIFPGVFSVELVHQAARLYCENYFTEARLARVGAPLRRRSCPARMSFATASAIRPPTAASSVSRATAKSAPRWPPWSN